MLRSTLTNWVYFKQSMLLCVLFLQCLENWHQILDSCWGEYLSFVWVSLLQIVCWCYYALLWSPSPLLLTPDSGETQIRELCEQRISVSSWRAMVGQWSRWPDTSDLTTAHSMITALQISVVSCFLERIVQYWAELYKWSFYRIAKLKSTESPLWNTSATNTGQWWKS